MPSRILPRAYFARPTLQVARSLLGKYPVRPNGNRTIAAKIIEIEAYVGPEDRRTRSQGLRVSAGRPSRYTLLVGRTANTMDFRRALVIVSRFWRISVILAIGAFAVYQFKTGAWTNHWTSIVAGVFLCVGLALNVVVLMLNNGFMPVRIKAIPRDYQTSHKSFDSRRTCD